jgi:hypothetical protein
MAATLVNGQTAEPYKCNHPSISWYATLEPATIHRIWLVLFNGDRVSLGHMTLPACSLCTKRPAAEPTPNLPPITTQLWNFARAVTNYTKSGFQNVDQSTYDRRMAECAACDKLNPDLRCTHCGCWVSEKALWASEDCPERKWTPIRPAQLQAAIQAICDACPERPTCGGPALSVCPKSLWPDLSTQTRPAKRSKCRTCG